MVEPAANWPYPWSQLEDIADQAGLERDELREYLRAEIDRRRALDAARSQVLGENEFAVAGVI